jgi:regulator of protease activity HflC (stomatin/prohibitin superfamily)
MGSISAVIQLFAFALFLVGFVGIALVVLSVSQNRPARNGVLLAIVGFLFGGIMLLVSGGILVVEPTQTAVIANVLSGELEEPARAPGTSIVIPGLQEVFVYPTSRQEYTMSGVTEEGRQQGDDSLTALTRDGQEISMDVTVIYRIDRLDANSVHLKWQDRYEAQFIRPSVRAIARDVVSTYTASDIYGAGRAAMQTDIDAQLGERLLEDGITLADLLVRRIGFDPEFAQSITDKQIEEQRLQRAQTEAERVRTEAAGQAEAAIEGARGEAQSALIRAQAEAEALRLVSEQIAANPNLIQFEYIKQVAPNITVALVPSDSPFLFDGSTFLEIGEGFTAPEVTAPVLPEPIDLSGNGSGND